MWRSSSKALPRNRKADKPDNVDRMWHLLRQAARTQRSFRRPPRQGYPTETTLPESKPEYSEWDMWRAAMQDDGEPPKMEQHKAKVQPSAAEITDCDYILWLFHRWALRGKANRPYKLRSVWDCAHGDRAGVVRRRYGLTAYGLARLKEHACLDMLLHSGLGKKHLT